MDTFRLTTHPILPVEDKNKVTFYWENKPLKAVKGEKIASALFANGIKIFGHHEKDNSAQGIFCANGQCSKCTVIANGVPVKSCMTAVKENMIVMPAEGLPELPDVEKEPVLEDIESIKTDVLIIGGGPAGLSASLQIAENNIKSIILDDKEKLGGKLVLQTHKFFGSVEDSYAGTRGIEIGELLANKVNENSNIDVWTESTAIFVFKDKKVGVFSKGKYKIIEPKVILNAAGAREKFLRFPGNTLAGIYGAGAFQTLVNRDLIKASERLFIVGGGNVGLIAGYHALQAGIEVVGLIEAMPKCGGYKVHADKLKRFGVPIYTSHTIVSANGEESVDSVTIGQIDDKFNLIPGTEKSFKCDTILIAVGLESVKEFTDEAEKAGMNIFSAGDAEAIAEASSAMFNGKIVGLKIAKFLGAEINDVPESWYEKAQILKKHPGEISKLEYPKDEKGIMPIINCIQEIPCNPCSTVCPVNAIQMQGDPITGKPVYTGGCIGCGLCVVTCPGLAITLSDYRKDADNPIVKIPYEIGNIIVNIGDKVDCVDIDGNFIDKFEVVNIEKNKKKLTQIVSVKADKENVKKIVAFKVQADEISKPLDNPIIPTKMKDDAMVCLCERVTAGEIRKLIKEGIYDLNQIKAITRAGMGPCGAKTCDNLIKQIFREEGISTIVDNTRRPLYVEVPLGVLAGKEGGENE